MKILVIRLDRLQEFDLVVICHAGEQTLQEHMCYQGSQPPNSVLSTNEDWGRIGRPELRVPYFLRITKLLECYREDVFHFVPIHGQLARLYFIFNMT